jgi:hypothetical protein
MIPAAETSRLDAAIGQQRQQVDHVEVVDESVGELDERAGQQ